ncbi:MULTISPECIES: helix-turn-helix domain-containing protein [unclassified Meiothermus]|uniref:helix-turn-helix domain-containing protein n=1 Tax=unclassified Meiothermus TaxID=370471 RepID=UPI000D7CD8BC|nr:MULTISPECIES: helix-turn-helix domain-containing protein [unclassified Meiothermus]PZA08720.1 hypothetical protein DNA98_01350 [Meiothermus sp. Pnk-1]RYM40659.1 DNA-binding protein [Meiothermus sp. PNK-Is4]
MNKDQDHKKLIKVTEAAKQLGVSRQTLARWIRQGWIPAVQIGDRFRVSAEVIEELLDKAKKVPTPQAEEVG